MRSNLAMALLGSLLLSSCMATGGLLGALKQQAQAPAHLSTNVYFVENQWGGPSAPWNAGGYWIIGGRASHRVVKLDASSSDGGLKLVGKVTYDGEATMDFKAKRVDGVNYEIFIKRGGSCAHAHWQFGGAWVIGGRPSQPVVDIHFSSSDHGENFSGVMTYFGEGPIGFRARQA